ncbi:hypothetical protein OS493_024383 [Desmophyllum pertusum]|uniref:LicD/FKTN/FKRP nucleotidyltransferase domain-containing protein n=1 Tax=Desmophyllum pertusum TaxID=174260 RepID=A0A9W9YLN4_9CNID|nr:hypothetical protein OS493_024383 [Desmophyllum pertusum]
MARIIDGHYDNLRKLLREIEFITSTNGTKTGVNESATTRRKTRKLCAQKCIKALFTAIRFYRNGFETEECSVKRDIKDLVTLIFDEVVVTTATGDQNIIFNSTGRVGRFFTFVESVYRLFPGIRTHFILGKNWNERHLDAIKDKTTSNLHTKMSLHSLRNYAFNKGELLQSPFLAKTSVLREIGFHLSGKYGLFRELFLRVKDRFSSSHPGLDHGGTAVVTCPDVMFHMQSPPIRDEQLVNFANKHDIKKIVEADGRTRWFGCRRGIKHRNGDKCPLKSGLVVPPCCLENLADAIQFVMEQCIRNDITCELQEGTLLGAVKLNKVLPWERDADITFLTADFPKLVKIKDLFTRQGYVVHDIKEPWCCVEGSKAGGKLELLADGWSIQMYGQHRMNPRETLTNGHLPTKVFFSGSWLNVPFNPGSM